MNWPMNSEQVRDAKPETKKSRFSVMACCCIFLLVTLGTIIYLNIKNQPADIPNAKSPHRIISNKKYVKPSRHATKIKTEASISNNFAEVKSQTREFWLGVEIDHKVSRTNSNYIIETIYTKDGRSHKYIRDNRPKIFETTTDQILALATSDNKAGSPPLPSVPNFETEFKKSLERDIVIDDNDSFEVKQLKERVKQARQEMKELLASGMSAKDVLRKSEQQRQDDASLRYEAVKGVRKMIEEGDLEGAQELCKRYNAALENMGFMKIELPYNRERKVKGK